MTNELTLKFRSEPRLLGSIRALTHRYLELFPLPQERIQLLVLAIDEACANAIRHGNCGNPEKLVMLTFARNGTNIEISVGDEGAPFFIDSSTCAAPPFSPEQVRPGGLGLKLMDRAFDSVCIRHQENSGNLVCMSVCIAEDITLKDTGLNNETNTNC